MRKRSYLMPRVRLLYAPLFVVLSTFAFTRAVNAQDETKSPPTAEAEEDLSNLRVDPTAEVNVETLRARIRNATSKTLGGVIMWADEFFFHDWHIQRHALTGHCRLLDADGRRVCAGSFDDCWNELEHIRKSKSVPPMEGKCIVIVHGLGGFPAGMSPLASHLKKECKCSVVNIAYPSTLKDMAEHANTLDRVVKSLNGVEEISFVGHSMGNIVIRHYLADLKDPAKGRKADGRIKRFVMLGPPNHGAELADAASDFAPFSFALGPAAVQLGKGWKDLLPKLATPPPCEFGIIAGGMGDEEGFSRLVPGDDDGLVSIKSAKLSGAHDFIVIPYRHSIMLFSPVVHSYVASFINSGAFKDEELRMPIE